MLERLVNDTDVLTSSLEKKRTKLLDADIKGNIDEREKEISLVEKRLDQMQRDLEETRDQAKKHIRWRLYGRQAT